MYVYTRRDIALEFCLSHFAISLAFVPLHISVIISRSSYLSLASDPSNLCDQSIDFGFACYGGRKQVHKLIQAIKAVI